jgi:hypothetical protein
MDESIYGDPVEHGPTCDCCVCLLAGPCIYGGSDHPPRQPRCRHSVPHVRFSDCVGNPKCYWGNKMIGEGEVYCVRIKAIK